MIYFTYVLISGKYKKTYVGISKNLDIRLKQHNKGYHFYTKRYVLWRLKYFEEFNNRIEARKREIYFKSATGRSWMKKNLFNEY